VSKYEVVLKPGQVLYVPKHWWHYVECESTAISVNTWVGLVSYHLTYQILLPHYCDAGWGTY